MGEVTVGLLLVRFLHLGPYQLVLIASRRCYPPEVDVSVSVKTYEVEDTSLGVRDRLHLL